MHWSRLPSEAIKVASLQEFKKCLGNVLRHMLGFLGLSCVGPGIGPDDSCRSLPAQDCL